MSYDDWKTDADYCMGDYGRDSGDWVHINDVPDTDAMGELLSCIVKQLYSTEHLEEEFLEDNLLTLCRMLEVKVPKDKELMIDRRQKWKKTG